MSTNSSSESPHPGSTPLENPVVEAMRLAESGLNQYTFRGLPLGVCACQFLDRSYFGDVEQRPAELLRLLLLAWAKHFRKKRFLRDTGARLVYLKTGRDRHYCTMEAVARRVGKDIVILGPQGLSDLSTGQTFFHAHLGDLLQACAFIRRRRKSIHSLVEPLGFSETKQRAFRLFLVRQLIKGTSIQRFLARQAKLKLLVTDYDRGADSSLFVAAGSSLGLKTITFQHGIISPPVGFAPVHADEIWVWGELARRQLLASGVPDRQIRLTGTPIVETISLSDAHRQSVLQSLNLPDKPTLVLGLSRPDPDEDRYLMDFYRLLREVAGADRYNFTVKTHPSYAVDYHWVEQAYGFTLLPRTIPYTDFMNLTDVLLVHNSGVAAEALYYGKKVGLISIEGQLPVSTNQLYQHLQIPLLHIPADITDFLDSSRQTASDLVFKATGQEAQEQMADALRRHLDGASAY